MGYTRHYSVSIKLRWAYINKLEQNKTLSCIEIGSYHKDKDEEIFWLLKNLAEIFNSHTKILGYLLSEINTRIRQLQMSKKMRQKQEKNIEL